MQLIQWLVEEIGVILEISAKDHWTHLWFDVLKKNAVQGFKPKVPLYGYGDPISYAIMEGAVSCFAHNRKGVVSHGAECFNYRFPQELDDQFSIISNCLEGNVSWKYVNRKELIAILIEKKC